ncbi:DNA-binding domain-containing protein [Caulobacter mirabilis]|uniref:DUF2063 domain-containing protein n=1 Tax=Caulobacter mirabilis TaxID=69666 RepID=A0A2D2B2X8_9CAUL|nr:DNA-binding domain-containing protein [Caulobacter mirabilis]ATQ44620.1 DUF2063 domain-containing protein [Caulobacter mirabilis]
MNLLALQRDFGRWLRTGEDAAGLGPTYAPGLNVHLNNYRSQLVSCLEATFPRTRQWIGGSAFQAAVAAHVDRVPPSSWTLDAYGRGFPETLARLYPGDPEIRELARLELALEEAFVAADHRPLNPADLAAADWDTAVLRFSPTLRICVRATNASEIWSALSRDHTPPPAASLDSPGGLLVWRREGVSCFRALDPLERDALLLACAGCAFAEVCDVAVERLGEAAGVETAGAFLGQWIRDGLVAGIR